MKNKLFGVMQRVGRSFMPGRKEDDQESKLCTRADVNAAKENKAKENKANGNITGNDEISALIVQGLGGSNNINDVDCCATRLRITVNNPNIIKEGDLEASGAAGVIKKGNGIQVIYGPCVTVIKSNLEDYLTQDNHVELVTEKELIENDQEQKQAKENLNDKEVKEMLLGRGITIYSPIKGNAVELEKVGDGVFSSGMLGQGIAIEPSQGRAVAPVAGTISMVFETKHAIGITSDNGVEILIHIGLDTVQLNGKYYTTHVNTGDHVKAGDLLVEFDMENIKSEGYQVITPIIITNSTDYKQIKPVTIGAVKEQDVLLKINK